MKFIFSQKQTNKDKMSRINKMTSEQMYDEKRTKQSNKLKEQFFPSMNHRYIM